MYVQNSCDKWLSISSIRPKLLLLLLMVHLILAVSKVMCRLCWRHHLNGWFTFIAAVIFSSFAWWKRASHQTCCVSVKSVFPSSAKHLHVLDEMEQEIDRCSHKLVQPGSTQDGYLMKQVLTWFVSITELYASHLNIFIKMLVTMLVLQGDYCWPCTKNAHAFFSHYLQHSLSHSHA